MRRAPRPDGLLRSRLHLVATGPRAGRRVVKLGSDPDAPVISTSGPRQARPGGFDLHANTAVRADDNRRLEHLCRYILRPSLAQDALELRPDGRVLLHLRRPWMPAHRSLGKGRSVLQRWCRDRPSSAVATATEGGRANLLIYHGAFAPRGCARVAAAVSSAANVKAAAAALQRPEGQAEPAASGPSAGTGAPRGDSGEPPAAPRPPPGPANVRPTHVAWARLLQRVFEFDPPSLKLRWAG